MNRTDEFGVKKNVLSILYYVGVWLCQGGFAQEKTWLGFSDGLDAHVLSDSINNQHNP